MTNTQDFFEFSRKAKFPRIIKVKAMPERMKKQLDHEANYRKMNKLPPYTDNDLVIVRLTTYGKNPSYSFERITGDPVSYLLSKLWDTEEKCREYLESLPCGD